MENEQINPPLGAKIIAIAPYPIDDGCTESLYVTPNRQFFLHYSYADTWTRIDEKWVTQWLFDTFGLEYNNGY